MNFQFYKIASLILAASFIMTSPSYAGGDDGNQSGTSAKENLQKFAYANCLFWHFKEKGFDTKDIRSVSGGFVEMGTSSAEIYQEIALSIKSFKTKRKTKQNVDPSLLKCFFLEDNLELQAIINKASK